MIDGIFAELKGEGELVFHPDFVHHALGLVLVRQLERAGPEEDASNLLEKFLDPINDYDNRAEILRATATIALQRGHSPQPGWLSIICTFWIHTQNLPDSHLEDLAILAPELITSLLDVIEASDGHALSTPRCVAVHALAGVDKSAPLVANEIAKRGARWLSFISLEKRGSDSDLGENSSYAYRCKRLRERIGTSDVGPVSVAGRRFESLTTVGTT